MVKDIVLVLIGMLFGGTAILVFACCALSGRISEQEYLEELRREINESGIRE